MAGFGNRLHNIPDDFRCYDGGDLLMCHMNCTHENWHGECKGDVIPEDCPMLDENILKDEKEIDNE